jgi:hypothetical protein
MIGHGLGLKLFDQLIVKGGYKYDRNSKMV